MEGNLTGNEHRSSFRLSKFTAPDQNEYTVSESFDGTRPPSIYPGKIFYPLKKTCANFVHNFFLVEFRANRVLEPFLLNPEDGLSITLMDIVDSEYTFCFSWNGDKLIKGK